MNSGRALLLAGAVMAAVVPLTIAFMNPPAIEAQELPAQSRPSEVDPARPPSGKLELQRSLKKRRSGSPSALSPPPGRLARVAEPPEPPFIKVWADKNTQPIVTHLWVSTAFAVVAWLLSVALKTNRAQIRYWVWFAASMKFLAPFALLVSAASHVSWRTETTAPPKPVASEASWQPFANDPPPAALIEETPFKDFIPVWLLSAWASGFGVLVLRWGRDWIRMRRIVRSGTPLELGLPVPVRSSSALIEPGIFGIFRPVLLLPEGIAEKLTPEQLHMIVAHEMYHVRRRDNLATSMHMVVEAVFWFHPLVWWIGARLLEERERSCDEEVVRSGNDPQTYAEGILKVCELYLKAPLECVAGVSGANLNRRVWAIMTDRIVPRLSVQRKALLASAAMLSLAAPFAVGLMDAPLREVYIPNGAAFKVVSIKVAPLPALSNIQAWHEPSDLPGFLPDGRFASSGSIREVLAMAYNLPPSPSGLQLRGIPDWIGPSTSRLQARVSRVSGVSDSIESKEVTYTIDATGVFPSGLSQKAREDRERAMLQNLLADRFKLKIHHETGEMPVMALIVPEGGPKLEKADIEERDCPAAAPEISVWTMCHTVTRLQGRGFFGRAVNMSDLLRQFQNSTSFPLVDNTGIHGLYRIETTASLGPALPSDGGISEAAQQLGLKLEMRSSRVDVYVIDHIEKPTVN